MVCNTAVVPNQRYTTRTPWGCETAKLGVHSDMGYVPFCVFHSFFYSFYYAFTIFSFFALGSEDPNYYYYYLLLLLFIIITIINIIAVYYL